MIAHAPARNHPAYWAFLVHRLSGVALALFLPVHFWVLGTVLRGTATLDGLLAWTNHTSVKFAEFGLAFLLAAHLTGGLRLLALEFLGWRDWQKNLIAVTAGISMLTALLFLLRAF